MKRVVVRLAMDDDVDVQQFLGGMLKYQDALHGAMVVGGESSMILAGGSDQAEATEIAQFLAGDDGSVVADRSL